MTTTTLLEYGFEPKAPEVIDSSMLKDFIDCPSMFYLRHILGLKPRLHDPSYESKFDWGTCWHEVLYAYYNSGRDLTAGLERLEEAYPSYITSSTDKYKRSKQRMAEAFFGYLEEWKDKDERNLEFLRNEQYFNVYNEDVDLTWCGRIDSLRRWKGTDRIVVWDYKTSSAMGPLYFDQHEIGFQFPGYAWASSQMFGEEVLEVCVDVMYMVSRSVKYRRKTFRYSSARISEWVSNVKWWLERMYFLMENYLHDPEAWGKNWNECTRYGRCPFFDVHSVAPMGDIRLRLLQDKYKVDRWDPSDMGDED